MVTGNVEIAHLIARSNHQDKDGFGGYYLYANMKDQKLYFKKEETHAIGYSPRLAEAPITFEKNKWYKMSISVLNGVDRVAISGKFDNVAIGVTDDGTLKGAPYMKEGKWCFIRTNSPDNVQYRNASIKAI